MSWIERIRGLFGQKTRVVATMVPTWQERQAVYPEINFENMVRQGWRRNELIFACVQKTANTASQVSLKVYSATSDKELPDHPLRRLLAQPNPYMSEYELWRAIIIYLKLAGVAYFEKVRSEAGVTVQLWPLRPDWVRPIPSATTFIGGYEYCVPGLAPFVLRSEDVLRFVNYDPLNLYGGWAPAAVAVRSGDVDNAATDYIRLFWEKGGVPMGLLKTKQRVSDTIVADIRRRWRERYGGYQNWTEPAVLDSDAEYQRTGLTFDEMGFETLDERDEVRICMVMDVPPIIVGAGAGLKRSTYSNYNQARISWWQDSLMPTYQHYDDVINANLVKEYEGVYTKWDFSDVPALQAEINFKWQRAREALLARGITINEYRAMIGYAPIRGGDIFLPMGAGMGTSVAVSGEEEDELSLGGKARPYTAKASPRNEDERIKQEKKLKKAMESYFSAQLGRIREAVDAT